MPEVYHVITDTLSSLNTGYTEPQSFFDSLYWIYIFYPLVIVLARMTDVTLSTLRIILLSKGYRSVAPIVGFFEVLLWVLVAGRIISEGLTLHTSIAYSIGFALGTFVGMTIDNRLSLGKVLIRVIISQSGEELQHKLRANKFGVTSVDAMGKNGPVKVLFIAINRTEQHLVIKIIRENNPNAFYTIENVQTANAGFFADGFGGGSVLGRVFTRQGK